MIANLDKDENRMAIMEGIVMRGAPILMRAGGGALSQARSAPYVERAPMADEKREQALKLAASAKYTATEIARMVGATQSAIFKLLAKHGIKARNGNLGRRKKESTNA